MRQLARPSVGLAPRPCAPPAQLSDARPLQPLAGPADHVSWSLASHPGHRSPSVRLANRVLLQAARGSSRRLCRLINGLYRSPLHRSPCRPGRAAHRRRRRRCRSLRCRAPRRSELWPPWRRPLLPRLPWAALKATRSGCRRRCGGCGCSLPRPWMRRTKPWTRAGRCPSCCNALPVPPGACARLMRIETRPNLPGSQAGRCPGG